jgi:hypothetical protein
MRTLLAHLPEKKRQELAHILWVIFKEFNDRQKGKSEKKRAGKILKVILFDSYARGAGWKIWRAAIARTTTFSPWSTSIPQQKRMKFG